MQLPFETRQFVFACRIASVYCLICQLLNILGGLQLGLLTVLFVLTLALEAMRWKALRRGITPSLQWAFAISTSIGLALAYMLNGGLHGSVPLVFLLALFLAVSIGGSNRLQFLVLYLVVAGLCISTQSFAPQWIHFYPNERVQYFDSSIGMIMAMLALGYGTHHFKSSYDRQRVRVLQRGEQVSRAYADLQTGNAKLQDVMRRNHEHLHIIAHDLRNPVGAVIGLVEVCREEYKLDPNLAKDLDTIERAAQQALGLVLHLSEVAYLEERKVVLEPRRISLSRLLGDVVRKFEPRARKKNQTLQTDIVAELEANLDAARLTSIIDNLLDNAIKYSPTGSSIQVLLESSPTGIVLRIRDAGPGIPPDQRAKLFTMFGKVGNRPTGKETATGLGLYIGRMLAELHGGHLEQENLPEGGSEFRLVLPEDCRTESTSSRLA